MSVVVAVRKNGRAAIAADSQIMSGSAIISSKYLAHYSKIHSFEDSFIGLVGAVSMSAVFKSLLSRHAPKLDFHNAFYIFEASRKLHKILIDEYHINPQNYGENEVECSHLNALIVNARGVFSLEEDRSVIEWTRFAAIGCGSSLALGAMHALYDRCDDPEAIAKAGVEAACEFDPGCGLPVDCWSVAMAPIAEMLVVGGNGDHKPRVAGTGTLSTRG